MSVDDIKNKDKCADIVRNKKIQEFCSAIQYYLNENVENADKILELTVSIYNLADTNIKRAKYSAS